MLSALVKMPNSGDMEYEETCSQAEYQWKDKYTNLPIKIPKFVLSKKNAGTNGRETEGMVKQ